MSVISCSISVRTEHTSEAMLELMEHSQQALKNRTYSGIHTEVKLSVGYEETI